MSATINQLNFEVGDDVYYTSGFHDYFMSFYFYFTNPNNNVLSQMAVDPNIAYKYQADFYGLLNHYGIPPEYWWCVLVLNNFKSPVEMNKDILLINIPDYNEIEVLKNQYESLD